ncbi:dynein-related subfamily AAA family protein [Winogradskyella pacifica]|uniref:Dynein-related subfamily AAA family protein n=1 Tax=Winogradskyella pacifica TaxID=664642 RepID=A0A3D9N526_9FLAO|nr:AAA family ATPase [Winogradskyella pacifica]REE27252.1 dynein-related subfamily AAA family protein [Winogradskyella pacifica]
MTENEKQIWKSTIEQILVENESWDKKNKSERYHVIFKKVKMPPKVVLARAFNVIEAEYPELEVKSVSGGVPTNQFIEEIGFKITEDFIYNTTDRSKLIKHLEKRVKKLDLFQGFIKFGHTILTDLNIEVYKVRLAIESQGILSVIVGMRAAYSYIEKDDYAHIGFLVSKKFKDQNKSKYNFVYDYPYKGEPEQNFIKIKVKNWSEVDEELIQEHKTQFQLQYNAIKNSKRTQWNVEANTTNNALKYLMFKNENIEKFMSQSNKEKNIIDLSKNRIYKLSMGTFLKTTAYRKANLLEKFEGHKWAVMGRYTGNNQGENWMNEAVIGDYAYITCGRNKLSHLIRFTSNSKELPKEINDIIGNSEFTYREYEIILKPFIDNTRSLVNDKRDWLPSGYSTFKEIKNIEEANKLLFQPFYQAILLRNNNIENLINVKKEFIDWLLQNPRSNYFNNDVELLNRYLDEYNTYFDMDIFEVSKSNYFNIIKAINEVAYKNEDNDFIKYSKRESTHRPRAILGKDNYYKFLNQKFGETNNNDNGVNRLKEPLNQILYGPPGTGKTFFLQNEYFSKFTISEENLTTEQVHDKIAEDLSWWQTFAIALRDIGESNTKEILAHPIVKAKERLSSAKSIHPILWSRLQAHTVNSCPNVNVKDRSEPQIFFKTKESKWSLEEEAVVNLYPEVDELLNEVKDPSIEFNDSIKNFEFVTFHQSFTYEDFVEGIKPLLETGSTDISYEIKDGVFKQLAYKAEQDPDNDYAIFIDEINRGNVASIFGELITLLEGDKRIGEVNEIKVRLPYSKKMFGVPSNLYVIGTMNTADRSVEALDSALRRRFSFKEVMPNYKVISTVLGDKNEWNDTQISVILEKINKRIKRLIDRDHQIGHSYFLKLSKIENINITESLKAVFSENIIPLLQEYFFNDFNKIGLVLGDGFLKTDDEMENERKENLFAVFSKGDSSNYEDEVFEIIDPKTMEDEEFINAINKLIN